MKRMRVAATSPVVSLGAAIEQHVRQGRAVALEACGHPALWRALLGLIYADGFLREEPAFLGEGDALAVVPARRYEPGTRGERIIVTLQTTTIRRDAA